MALNMQIIQQRENKRLKKNDAKYINIIEKTPHANTQKESPRTIKSKPL
jgi:hypothetical protein